MQLGYAQQFENTKAGCSLNFNKKHNTSVTNRKPKKSTVKSNMPSVLTMLTTSLSNQTETVFDTSSLQWGWNAETNMCNILTRYNGNRKTFSTHSVYTNMLVYAALQMQQKMTSLSLMAPTHVISLLYCFTGCFAVFVRLCVSVCSYGPLSLRQIKIIITDVKSVQNQHNIQQHWMIDQLLINTPSITRSASTSCTNSPLDSLQYI